MAYKNKSDRVKNDSKQIRILYGPAKQQTHPTV